jgi:pilus assembly protein FimV
VQSCLLKTGPVQTATQGLCVADVQRASSRKLWARSNASTWVLAGLLSLGSLVSFDACAVALGRLNVLSSIGEPLRAEVEILDLTPAEANSIRPSLASEDAYTAMGLDYNPDLKSIQFNVRETTDGRTVLQLNNSRPVTAAFIDLVLEVSWATGKITRDFTLLLTPAKSASSAQPVAPVLPMADIAVATKPAGTVAVTLPAAPRSSPQRVTVVRGDTASQLVMQSLPVNVSLDQMLLALLRSNPDAFVAGNVNRLKAGAVLSMPTAGDATTVPRSEARKTIIAQSRDFNAFRQQLASNARPAQVAASGREATGQVKSSVKEKTPDAAAADKLTLSKGALKGTAAGTASAEEKIAQERQAKEAADRMAELSKNISDLSQLNTAPATTVANVTDGTKPATTSPAEPALAAGAPPAITEDTVQTGLIGRLSNHPTVLPAAAVFLSLLLAWSLFRFRRNSAAKNKAFKTALDEANETDKGTDKSKEPSFDGDAQEATMPASAVSTRPTARKESLEDDPLTIAQSELAAGREVQAEVLLLGALKRTPHRLALHIELMDIYVSRNDAAGFERLAIEALTITSGQGANWERICTKGRALDPTNPLFQTVAASPSPPPPFSKIDFDLELGSSDKIPPKAKS